MRYEKWPEQVEPLDWYRLIQTAERVRALTGAGLASIWGHINNGQYAAALARLNDYLEAGTMQSPDHGAVYARQAESEYVSWLVRNIRSDEWMEKLANGQRLG